MHVRQQTEEHQHRLKHVLPISTLLLVVGKIYVKGFFRGITQPSSCLHFLLPAPREQSRTARVRSVQKYPRVYTRTSRYCSFINYSLNNYQDKITNSI